LGVASPCEGRSIAKWPIKHGGLENATFFNVWRRTVVHSYSKKMLESGDNHIKKKPTKT
jgi:hypothetical protein